MSGATRVRSANIAELDSRPVLVPGGNKTKLVSSNSRKLASKSVRKVDGKKAEEKMGSAPASGLPPPLLPSASASKVLRRQEVLLRSDFSLNASCSSDCSTESFRSRASTGRIVNGGRPGFTNRRRQGVPRPERIASKLEGVVVPEGIEACSPEVFDGKMRCPWVTRNTESCYVAFHDEEWGVPVHDDKKLFELLVLCGALAELTWPTILSKRHIFREVFMDFDPVEISKLNENKIISLGSSASSLLTEPKLRAIVENARQILKIIEECGSFDRYCWSFVNNKPIVSRFRYSRQVPVKTSKADIISRDLLKRGFRCVGPTIIYSFMQVAGLTNDHLTCCYRFEECCAPIQANHKMEENSSLTCTTNTTAVAKQVDMSVIIELDSCVDDLNIS